MASLRTPTVMAGREPGFLDDRNVARMHGVTAKSGSPHVVPQLRLRLSPLSVKSQRPGSVFAYDVASLLETNECEVERASGLVFAL
jgi:hypothetical protein